MTGRKVLVEVTPRAEQQIYDLPEVLGVKVRSALLSLLDNPIPLADGAIPFRAGGDETPNAYEWDIGGVAVFYNIIETGPLLIQVIIQVVLVDAL